MCCNPNYGLKVQDLDRLEDQMILFTKQPLCLIAKCQIQEGKDLQNSKKILLKHFKLLANNWVATVGFA